MPNFQHIKYDLEDINIYKICIAGNFYTLKINKTGELLSIKMSDVNRVKSDNINKIMEFGTSGEGGEIYE